MGTLTGTLTQEQLDWLNGNLSAWYGVDNCTVAKYSTWTYVCVLILQPGTSIITNLHVNNDGTTSFSGYQDISSSTYWKGVFEATDTTNMYYYYVNHGDNLADSYVTIDIPDMVYNVEDRFIQLRQTGIKIFEKLKNYCTFINDSLALDDIYINDVSGDKYASKLLLSHLNQNGTISAAETERVAKTLFARYGDIWEKLWAVVNEQYNPLENYHQVEEHSKNDTLTETPTNWTKTDESQAAYNVETDKNKVYGFNSSSPVNESENEKTFAHKNTETQAGTYERKTTYGHKIERTGNIGASPAELLESQRNFIQWDFYQVVFNDIDYLLTKNYVGGFN